MRFLRGVRVFTTSARTIVRGVVNVVTRRIVPSRETLRAGDIAPDFELPASNGRTYRLSGFRDRSVVVLAWFPAAFTGGCTAQCQSIGGRASAFERFEAAVFGASVDDVDTLRDFAAAYGLGFPILSDRDRRVARAYGVLGASGLAARITFYIGRDGRILAVDREGTTTRHGASIAGTLERLGIPRRLTASAVTPLTS
jgi:peroxiredoxin Q/BCP